MNVTNYTKKIYDLFGEEYQKTREDGHINRVYNEHLGFPNMIKAVGNIKNKHLLYAGCGAGVHIKEYQRKGAKVKGFDISKTMVSLAKKNCPKTKLEIGDINKIPFSSSSFDVVTASLILDYVNNLKKAFKEVARVLKKGGLFYYSNDSIFNSARSKYEDNNIKMSGAGYFFDKKTKKLHIVGDAWKEQLMKWEMLPGIVMKQIIKLLELN